MNIIDCLKRLLLENLLVLMLWDEDTLHFPVSASDIAA